VVLFCAGIRRLCVPHARFLLHGVMSNFPGPASLDEKQLEERLKGLQIDMGAIARIVANATLREPQSVLNDMRNRLTLLGEEAVTYGLVHEIKPELYETGAEVISIQMGAPVASPPVPQQQPPQQGFPPGFSYKPPQN
jgi:ATP-dependent Clp protease, protease subunit